MIYLDWEVEQAIGGTGVELEGNNLCFVVKKIFDADIYCTYIEADTVGNLKSSICCTS